MPTIKNGAEVRQVVGQHHEVGLLPTDTDPLIHSAWLAYAGPHV